MVHLSLVPSSYSSSNNQDDPNELADASLAATRMTSSHQNGWAGDLWRSYLFMQPIKSMPGVISSVVTWDQHGTSFHD